jgi:hypothetical protein
LLVQLANSETVAEARTLTSIVSVRHLTK